MFLKLLRKKYLFLHKFPAFLFLALSCMFHLDKLLLGPYGFVTITDAFDSEFPQFKAVAGWIRTVGLIQWLPNIAGGMPAYANQYALYHPFVLLAFIFPLWFIYFFLVITWMFLAGYGMYLLLKDFFECRIDISILGGTLFALSSQIQLNITPTVAFLYTFPLFAWMVFSKNQNFFKRCALLVIMLFSYPVITFPFFSVLHLILIFFKDGKGQRIKKLLQWTVLWLGYLFLFYPVIQSLRCYLPVMSRYYSPNSESIFSLMKQYGFAYLTYSMTISFFCGSLFLICYSKSLRNLVYATVFFVFLSSFFRSIESNFLFGTIFMKMDLFHFYWTLNIMAIFVSSYAINLVIARPALFSRFVGGGANRPCRNPFLQTTCP